MPQRLRKMLRHTVNSTMVAFSIAAQTASGQSRTVHGQIIPQPFTTLPVRAHPAPVIHHDIRNGEAAIARPMTAGEKKFLRNLFGDALPADELQVIFDRAAHHGDTATTHAALHVHDTRFYSKDYSKESNPAVFGHFVNAMTALMQTRGGDSWAADRTIAADMYLVDGRSFARYGMAQQRALMEDYALRFLHATRQSHWLSRVYNGDRSTTDPYLITAVEDAFPGAKKARLDFQQHVVRTLSPREKALVKGIFGSQIDTDIVRLNLSPLAYKDVAGAVASERDVYLYGRNRSDDFANESAYKLGVFIHEMTHVWQFQTKRRHTVVVSGLYEYTIDAGARFEDYNIEQQAAMIEDYLLYTLHKDREVRWLAESYNKNAHEIAARTPHMLATVEAFFPTARAWRMANQRHAEKLPAAHAEVAGADDAVAVARIDPPSF